MDKDELKKLDEWNKNRRAEEKLKYGLNFEDIKPDETEGVDKFSKFLKKSGKVYKIFCYILFTIVAIVVAFYVGMKYINIRDSVDVDAQDTMERMYDIKLKVISEKTEDNNVTRYSFKVKDMDITFNATKRYGSFNDDFLDTCHKYYFEKWNSDSKKDFEVEEKTNNGLLKFATYINAKNYEEAIDAGNKIMEFCDFSKQTQFPAWDVYINYNGNRIYVYDSNDTSKEKAINRLKEELMRFENTIG